MIALESQAEFRRGNIWRIFLGMLDCNRFMESVTTARRRSDNDGGVAGGVERSAAEAI